MLDYKEIQKLIDFKVHRGALNFDKGFILKCIIEIDGYYGNLCFISSPSSLFGEIDYFKNQSKKLAGPSLRDPTAFWEVVQAAVHSTVLVPYCGQSGSSTDLLSHRS